MTDKGYYARMHNDVEDAVKKSPRRRRMNARTYWYRLSIKLFGIACLTVIYCSSNQPFRNLALTIEEYPKIIALTFDDGPSFNTATILDILKKRNIRATFFVVGKNAERYPDLLKRIADEDHLLGVHTYSHSVWSSIKTPKQIATELNLTAHIIFKYTGIDPQYFRPPYGWESPWMVGECRRKGYSIIKWTIDPKDWQHPPADTITNKIVRLAEPGAIVLLHDGHQTDTLPDVHETVQALPAIIERLEKKGYRFVGIDEIIRKGGRHLALFSPDGLNIP